MLLPLSFSLCLSPYIFTLKSFLTAELSFQVEDAKKTVLLVRGKNFRLESRKKSSKSINDDTAYMLYLLFF
jgi:hypothetical protein